MDCVFAEQEHLFNAVGPGVVMIVTIFLLATCLALLAIKAVVYCKIFHKAGYCWAMGLLMLVPIACVIMPFILAFGRWPIEKELEQLRRQQENIST
jgi:hypothetical protein